MRRAAEAGGPAAAEAPAAPTAPDAEDLVRRHRGLAVLFAGRRVAAGYPESEREDLVQAGLVGIWKAAQSYRPELGKFSTWAAWSIRSELGKEAQRRRRFVGIPTDLCGRPVDGEAAIGEPAATEDGDHVLRAVQAEALGSLPSALARLPARERRIIEVRFGLLDGKGLTLDAVGDRLGLTKQRVQQIEASALKRLRRILGGQARSVQPAPKRAELANGLCAATRPGVPVRGCQPLCGSVPDK